MVLDKWGAGKQPHLKGYKSLGNRLKYLPNLCISLRDSVRITPENVIFSGGRYTDGCLVDNREDFCWGFQQFVEEFTAVDRDTRFMGVLPDFLSNIPHGIGTCDATGHF